MAVKGKDGWVREIRSAMIDMTEHKQLEKNFSRPAPICEKLKSELDSNRQRSSRSLSPNNGAFC